MRDVPDIPAISAISRYAIDAREVALDQRRRRAIAIPRSSAGVAEPVRAKTEKTETTTSDRLRST